MHQGALRDLSTGDLMRHFRSLLLEQRPIFRGHLEDRKYITKGSQDALDNIQVFIGIKTPTNARWAIRIANGSPSRKHEWLTTRARIETYRLYFDCMLRSAANKEEVDLAIEDFASIVSNYLLGLKRLQFDVAEKTVSLNIPVYNSWVDDINTGYTKDGAFRVARIDWWGQVVNVYNEVGVISIV